MLIYLYAYITTMAKKKKRLAVISEGECYTREG